MVAQMPANPFINWSTTPTGGNPGQMYGTGGQNYYNQIPQWVQQMFPGVNGFTGFAGAGLPQGAQFSQGGFGGGAGGLTTQNTLTPEQQGIMGGGAGMLSSLWGQEGYNPFQPFSPQQSADLYNQFFAPQRTAEFEGKVMPKVREAFAGPGTYWGGARAAGEAQARTDEQASVQNLIGQMFMNERNSARQALLPFALGLLNANTGVTYGQQGGGGGGGQSGQLMQMLQQLMQQPQQQQQMPQMNPFSGYSGGGYQPYDMGGMNYGTIVGGAGGTSGFEDFSFPIDWNSDPSLWSGYSGGGEW